MNTETNQTQENTDLSDYDAEWGLDDSLQQPAVNDSGEDSQTSTEATEPAEEALDAVSETTSESVQKKAAESDVDTTWADATPAQLEALKKAESDEKAMRGRFRLSNDKNSMLTKELEELRKQNADYQEKLRKPTQFEQDHPEYAEDIKALYGNRASSPTPVAEDPADIIIAAHSDAGEVYNSNEFQIWMNEQPVSTRRAIESSDAESIVEILTHYKKSIPKVSTTEPLQAIAGVKSSSGRVDIRKTSELSAAEQYDAEWDNDNL